MRRVSLLGLLAAGNFASAGMGQYFSEDGKLSPSNLFPVLFAFAAGPIFLATHKTIKKDLVGFLLLFNLLAWISFVIFAFRFAWPPNLPVLYFQELEIVFCALLVWYGGRSPDEFARMVRIGTLCSVLISIWYGYHALSGGTAFQVIIFGMDDKSQAAVLFCCQAFILMRYFKGVPEYLAAVLLMAMSFMTLSRLPVFFVPVIFLASVMRSRSGALLGLFVGSAIFIIVIVAGDVIAVLFKVFDRLTSVDAVATDGSTSAHLLLIQAALQVKFTDTLAFLFGTGPGNFARAISSFPISPSELGSLDPIIIQEARVGKAPMHSTPFSALLDYNLGLFCLLGYLLLRATRYLVVSRKYVELLFFVSLLGASSFYSLHNKPYLYIMCTTIFVLMAIGSDSRKPLVRTAAQRPSILSPGHKTECNEDGERNAGEESR